MTSRIPSPSGPACARSCQPPYGHATAGDTGASLGSLGRSSGLHELETNGSSHQVGKRQSNGAATGNAHVLYNVPIPICTIVL